jgi:hypothetical protein
MFVVPGCNEFVRAEIEDQPWPDFLADRVAVSFFIFMTSDVVGTSRPARAASLLRAISIRFIQPGRFAKIAKKSWTTLRSGRFRAARWAS